MTLSQLRSRLPKFAKHFGKNATTTEQLIALVHDELNLWRRGENPLTEAQVKAFYKFLEASHD